MKQCAPKYFATYPTLFKREVYKENKVTSKIADILYHNKCIQASRSLQIATSIGHIL